MPVLLKGEAKRAGAANTIGRRTARRVPFFPQDKLLHRIFRRLWVLAWDWTGLNGLVADSGDGVWGAGIREQGRGFLVRSRNKDSEPIRTSVERPSDHDAQGDE
jgi:hypothetical protein